MGCCGLQRAKVIAGNVFSPFSIMFNFLIIRRYFSSSQNFCFMKIFNTFKKHFKNCGNCSRQQFSTTIFGSNNESRSNCCFMKFREPIHQSQRTILVCQFKIKFLTITLIIFDKTTFRKFCFSTCEIVLYVVILPHFRENFRNTKLYSNEHKVIAIFVYRNDAIVSMKFS